MLSDDKTAVQKQNDTTNTTEASKKSKEIVSENDSKIVLGDVNGILYLMPQAWIWTIFAFILLFNIWILLKKVNPTYTASFKER